MKRGKDHEAAKHAVAEALRHGFDFVENAPLDPPAVDAASSRALPGKAGADNSLLHFDTHRMNIEEEDAAHTILAARNLLRCIHRSQSDRGGPGAGSCDWNDGFAALAAAGFSGGMAMESFINMAPDRAFGLSVWRPVADSREQVIGEGLPFVRQKARQYVLTGPTRPSLR